MRAAVGVVVSSDDVSIKKNRQYQGKIDLLLCWMFLHLHMHTIVFVGDDVQPDIHGDGADIYSDRSVVQGFLLLNGALDIESSRPSSSVVVQSSRFLLSQLPPLLHYVKLVLFGIHGKL